MPFSLEKKCNMNSLELEEIKSSIKRKVIFKYKPDFSTSFKTNIKESQVIPLCFEVCRLLKWGIIEENENIIVAIKHRKFGNSSEQISIKTSNHNKIYLNSISLKQRFVDFGNNSQRVQMFMTLFQKLEKEYQYSGKLEELETIYNKRNSWEDYKIPDTLPTPPKKREPNFNIVIIGVLLISIFTGVISGIYTFNFREPATIYPYITGAIIGYLFVRIVKYANFLKSERYPYFIIGIVFCTLIITMITNYFLLLEAKEIEAIHFYDFITSRVNNTLNVEQLNQGSSYIIQIIVISCIQYFIAWIIFLYKRVKYFLYDIPEEVTEYVLYLHHINTPESTIRMKLAEKGWSKKTDQNEAMDILKEY